VQAFDAATGRQRWSVSVPQFVVAAVRGDVVLTVGPAGAPPPPAGSFPQPVGQPLIATGLDLATGGQRWQTVLGRAEGIRPLVAADVVAVPYGYEEFSAPDQSVSHQTVDGLDPATGRKLWTRTTSAEGADPQVAADGGTVYIAQAGTQPSIEAVTSTSGATRWEASLENSAIGDVVTTPGVVAIGGQNNVVGLAATTGSRAWTWPHRGELAATTTALFVLEPAPPLNPPGDE
jgi:outer membrane protein assembly factor BamB